MQEQTDEDHYITMPEIKEELAKYDVTADRKSIYTDLRDLSVTLDKKRRVERCCKVIKTDNRAASFVI